jgi:electron transfer flavoprotein alpha subunit
MTTSAENEVWAVGAAGADGEDDISLEVVHEARALADRLGGVAAACLLGGDGQQLGPVLGQHGVDRVYVWDAPASSRPGPDWVRALASLAQERRPAIVLLPAAGSLRVLAARLSASLGTGLVSECTSVDIDGQGLLAGRRPMYGGYVSARVICPTARPQIATLQPGYARPRTPIARTAEVVSLGQAPPAAITKRLDSVRRDPPMAMDLGDADIVVAGGRGVGRQEGFRLLEELARRLGGAVAASRPAVDAGWVPFDRQVGLSGCTIAPKLYVACGVSGSPHHLAGMKNSGSLIAINTDRRAPIMGIADLALCGDLSEVVSALLERLPAEGAAGEGPADILERLGGV